MGLGKAIVEITVGIIALIVTISLIVFFVKLIAGIFIGLAVIAIIVGLGKRVENNSIHMKSQRQRPKMN